VNSPWGLAAGILPCLKQMTLMQGDAPQAALIFHFSPQSRRLFDKLDRQFLTDTASATFGFMF